MSLERDHVKLEQQEGRNYGKRISMNDMVNVGHDPRSIHHGFYLALAVTLRFGEVDTDWDTHYDGSRELLNPSVYGALALKRKLTARALFTSSVASSSTYPILFVRHQLAVARYFMNTSSPF